MSPTATEIADLVKHVSHCTAELAANHHRAANAPNLESLQAHQDRARSLEATQRASYCWLLKHAGAVGAKRLNAAAAERVAGLGLYFEIGALYAAARGRGRRNGAEVCAESYYCLAALDCDRVNRVLAERTPTALHGSTKVEFPCGPDNLHTSSLTLWHGTGELVAATEDYNAASGERLETLGTLTRNLHNADYTLTLKQGGKAAQFSNDLLPTLEESGSPDFDPKYTSLLNQVAGSLQESYDVYPVGADDWAAVQSGY